MEKRNIVENSNVKRPVIEDIVYMAAHDLKGPLRTIKSFSQLLDSSLGDRFTEDEKGLLGFIIQATTNLESLIVKLVEFSKVGQPLNISKFKIDNLLQLLVVQNNKLVKEKKATVEVLCDNNLVMRADKIRLIVLFENLLSNSLKFVSKTEAPKIEIKVIENKDDISFSILDNGIGIAESKLDKAFEVFERIHGTTDYNGSRIGLATCKRIVEVHGGTINITSEFGKYTKVNFIIPKNITT